MENRMQKQLKNEVGTKLIEFRSNVRKGNIVS